MPITRRRFLAGSATLGAGCGACRLLAGHADADTRTALARPGRHGLRAAPTDTAGRDATARRARDPTVHRAAPRAARDAEGGVVREADGTEIDYYEVSVRQFEQQVLPDGLPRDDGLGLRAGRAREQLPRLMVHNAPSLDDRGRNRQARAGEVDQRARRRRRRLPASTSSRSTRRSTGRTPVAGEPGRDTRPSSRRHPAPTRVRSRWSSTCTARWAWATRATATPRRGTCPTLATSPRLRGRGDLVRLLRGARRRASSASSGARACAIQQYPNTERAATNWYHDHTLGMTRLNVYAGPAGFFLVRGGPSDAVLDDRDGTSPPSCLDPLPRRATRSRLAEPYREIALAIQDRSFDADGSLAYPRSRAEFDGIVGPYLPEGTGRRPWGHLADLEPGVSSATRSSSTARRGRISRSSSAATASAS